MRLLFIVSLILNSLIAKEIDSYLSNLYKEMFNLELKKSEVQKNYNSLSWLSPIMLSFERSWSNQIDGGWNPNSIFSIGIEQPIFKSGGIYYGIKYAKSNYALTYANTIKERAKLNSSALGLLYQIKQTNLSIKKLKLQVKNVNIEVKVAKELFNAGLVDSIYLDDALLKESEANIALINLESTLQDLKAQYQKIGKRGVKSKLPKLKMLSLEEFLRRNSDISVAKAKALSSRYYAKMIKSKHLPTISVGARYTKLSHPTPPAKDAFTNYSLKVSMPISVNRGNEIEVAKLDSLISSLKVKTTLVEQKATYRAIKKRVNLIDKKIAFAKKEARAYKRILRDTINLYHSGQKSIEDVNLLKNSLEIKRLDIKIYKVQKNLEILKLYERVKDVI